MLNMNENPPVYFEEKLEGESRLIHEQAIFSAQNFLVAEANLLSAIMRVDADKTYLKLGLTHLTSYCVKYLKLEPNVAATFVTVARRSIVVPELKTAVDEGLSPTKARVISSVITPENQELWIEKAENLSKEKLEREVAEASPRARKPEKARVQGVDRIRVEFDVTQQEMAMCRRVQELEGCVSLREAFAAALPCYLDKHDPVRKADRAVARKTRDSSREESDAIPAAIKHQVNRRDRGCCQARMPSGEICGSRRWVHHHHIKERSNGGDHSLENIITLCSAHHRMWHAQRE